MAEKSTSVDTAVACGMLATAKPSMSLRRRAAKSLKFFDISAAIGAGTLAPGQRALSLEEQAGLGGWVNRMIRAAGLLVVVYNAASFVLLASVDGHRELGTLIPRMLNVAFGLGLFGITFTSFFARRWRLIVLLSGFAIIGNETAIALASGLTAPFGAGLLLFFVASGALIPWEMPWQMALMAWGMAAFAIFAKFSQGEHPLEPYRIFALLTGVGVALVSTGLGRSFREALSEHIRMLRESQARLEAQAIERERIIAEREIAERHARESEALLRKLFDFTPDVLVVTRLTDGRFLMANRAFDQTGFSREEAMRSGAISKRRWRRLEDRDRCIELLMRDGAVSNFETEFNNIDGSFSPNLISATLVEINDEPCAIWVNRDITDLKRTQQELVEARERALEASRFKSDFLSKMSHEMRTPLNAILGMVDLLRETGLSAEQRRYLEAMRSNGNVLLDLINDVLDLARIESGKLTLEHAKSDLAGLLDDLLESFGLRACEKNLELSGRIVSGAPTLLEGDAMRLRQVLANLVGNAIKFTERGEVTLIVANGRNVGELEFTVADTGVGIEPDKLGTIFESFSQGGDATARVYGGSGLGLAIVRQLVELMGGCVWVESKPGKGSIFRFTARFGLHPPAEPFPALLNGVKALVIERNANSRAALRILLEQSGAEVVELDAPELIMAQRLDRVGLIFFNCSSAEEARLVAERMGRVERTKLMPMIPADQPHILIPALREIGITGCLIKPVRRSDFLGQVQAVMADRLPGTQPELVTPGKTESIADWPLERAIRVLLADDSPDNRLVFELYLRGDHFRVDTVEDGARAVEKFKSGDYDVVLMDIQMPVIDGLTAVREIRRYESENKRRPIPIIALTASALEEDVRAAIVAGCDIHLAKPVRKAAMIAAINSAVKTATT
jgi:PAS domain S-box-containing protein